MSYLFGGYKFASVLRCARSSSICLIYLYIKIFNVTSEVLFKGFFEMKSQSVRLFVMIYCISKVKMSVFMLTDIFQLTHSDVSDTIFRLFTNAGWYTTFHLVYGRK